MLVTYTAPNRAHHYIYARLLSEMGCLQRFISGFSRFGPGAALPELGKKLRRADHLQNFYLASLRLHWPSPICEELTHFSKIWMDLLSTSDAHRSDIFLFYSGTGLRTLRSINQTSTKSVLEAVNSHILVQKVIMQEEHKRLKLPLKGFHDREIARRVQEIEEADGIICPSTFVRQSFLDQGKDPKRLKVVPFGLQPFTLPQQKIARPADTFRILFVGQINLRKGLRYLFDAFRKFKHPKKELWIVGPITDQTGIEDQQPPEETRFLGILKGEELSNAYNSCHVFVLPTIEEGLALVIGEALAHGLPVITTENSGARDLFTDGTTGFIVPIRSADAIAEKLQLLADNPSILSEMSNRSGIPDQGMKNWKQTGVLLLKALTEISTFPK